MIGTCSYCEVLGAWSTAVGAVVVFFGGLFALFQVHAAKTARQLQSIIAVFGSVDNVEWRHAQWFFYKHAKELDTLLDRQPGHPDIMIVRAALDDKIRKLSDGNLDLNRVELSLNVVNNVAYLFLKGYAPADLIKQGGFEGTFLRVEHYFRAYIQCRRNHEVGTAVIDYGSHLTLLVKKIKTGKFPRSRLQWLRDIVSNLEYYSDQVPLSQDLPSRVELIEKQLDQLRRNLSC